MNALAALAAEADANCSSIPVPCSGRGECQDGDVGELDDEGGFGASTLLRVLCHRSDRDASKFLKANMHLPKGDEGSVTAFLTGKGNSAAAYLAKKYEKYKK